VLVETALGFVAPGSLQVLFRFGTAVRKAVRRGYLFGLAPLSALSLGTQIDDGAHEKARRLQDTQPLMVELSANNTPIRGRWITVERYLRHTKTLSLRYCKSPI
jgi:hypothetical protein